jgi:hypothetical protein
LSFVPIGIEEYLELHLRSNPGEKRNEVLARLRDSVSAAVAGRRCQCGEPIWAIGSAVAGHACFSCITGEAHPSEDYEIDVVLARRQPGARGLRSRSEESQLTTCIHSGRRTVMGGCAA